MVADDAIADRMHNWLRQWGEIWGVPDLHIVAVPTFSRRQRRSLGRCRPSSGRITLNAALRDELAERLPEVLCHEAAHVAAHRLFGSVVEPHGPEWRRLVEAAGYAPTTRAGSPEGPILSNGPGVIPSRRDPSIHTGILQYEHRCAVCQSVRYARRPVHAWRCTECTDAGLEGRLVITRRPSPETDVT